MSIFVRVLGTVEVRRNGILTAVSAPKRRAMLLALALFANRPVSLDALIDTLWVDNPPPSATMNLRSHAHTLRPIVGRRLVTHSGAYELRLHDDELDSMLFTSLADRGTTCFAAGDLIGAAAAYGQALGLWHDTAVHSVPPTGRLDAMLAGLLERRRGVFEDYCVARLAGGAASELVPDLRQHLASHPYRERGWWALMLAQYRSGDVPGTLASFSQAQTKLREQLGVDPSPDLVALHRAVLARDPQLDDPLLYATQFLRTGQGGAGARELPRSAG